MLMAKDMRVTMSMANHRARESTTGPMVTNTKEAGRMESNTELVLSPLQMVKLKKENGNTVRGYTGFEITKSE